MTADSGTEPDDVSEPKSEPWAGSEREIPSPAPAPARSDAPVLDHPDAEPEPSPDPLPDSDSDSDPELRVPRNVPALLAQLRQERFTGAVTVEGGPGGTLFLREGLVGAVETPAAPSARSLLLKSGRIDEREWEAALAALPENGELGAVLTARGSVTAAELFVVCTAALFDGAFAMALQPVTGWRTDPERGPGHGPGRGPELAAWPGQEPARLTEETALRLRTLREMVPSVGEFARGAVRAEARSDADRIGERGRTLLLAANGRRTPRDLAFALGRGVYPVMLDLARIATRRAAARDDDPLAPRPLLTARAADRQSPPPPGADDRPLPRRQPGGQLPSTRPPSERKPPGHPHHSSPNHPSQNNLLP
ncbi:hypothetical protein ABZX65_09220 [Streptomyces sp. NPDC003300]|uniref:hypothetical protein n=1 Tax=unclassified Streptomyces TaxID=2593676 RepID=UPI0033A3E73B